MQKMKIIELTYHMVDSIDNENQHQNQMITGFFFLALVFLKKRLCKTLRQEKKIYTTQ